MDDKKNNNKVTKQSIEMDSNNDAKNNLKLNAIQVEMVNANDSSMNNKSTTEDKQKKKREKRKRARERNRSEAQIVEDIRNKLSCRKHVSPVGILILFAYLSISAGHFIIFYVYANYTYDFNFGKINRPGVWIFLTFSILYFLQFLFWIIRWKKMARKWMEKKYSISLSRRNARGNSNLLKRITII